jgi:hypothetical protein
VCGRATVKPATEGLAPISAAATETMEASMAQEHKINISLTRYYTDNMRIHLAS